MKRKATEKQITIAATPPRHVLIVERADGTFNVMEDDPKVLKAYRTKPGESATLHRAYVRNS